MNLQSMTIIFIIIFLPIILISTYYIQQEVDTIRMQESYDTKLIDATTDAVSAFEINTSNEDLSNVSDSLRSMIEASNEVFINTLATNLGMSNATKSQILPYIPAIVYTLYDGYYIYTPSQQPRVVTDEYGVYVKVGDKKVDEDSREWAVVEEYGTKDGKIIYCYNPSNLTKTDTTYRETSDYGQILYYADGYKVENENGSGKIYCTTDPNLAEYTTNYILKSYIPYSAKYKNSDVDITINYTLDNYVTVYGTIGDTYYNKSGYLIDYSKISEVKLDRYEVITKIDSIPDAKDSFALDEIDSIVENDGEYVIESFKILDDNGNEVVLNNVDQYANSLDYNGSKKQDQYSAIEYYWKAYLFSKWFDENIGKNLKEKDISKDTVNVGNNLFDIVQNGEIFSKRAGENSELFYNYGEKSIFHTGEGAEAKWNVENTESNFYEHKRKVIQNSIQYNLNLAMAIYNKGLGAEEYEMPILSEVEWDKLLSNVSVLAFMQGLPCGLKTYNNYALITSSNNQLMVNPEDIYYIPVTTDSRESDPVNGQGVLTTEMKKEIEEMGIDYSSVNLSTAHKIDCVDLEKDAIYYESFPSKDIKYDKVFSVDQGRKYVYDHVCNTCYECIVNNNYEKVELENLSDKQRKARLIAIGKIKNNLYKSSVTNKNYGMKIVEKSDTIKDNNNYKIDVPVGCYEIQVTIKNGKKRL